MATRMQQRRGTSSQWTAANPVLGDGEIGIEKDTGVVKVGNGVSTWNQLSPILGSSYLPLLGKAYDSERLDGLDSSAFLLANDATVARKSYVDTGDTAVLNSFAGTSTTRKLSYHWGDVTAFPTVGVLTGDTCRRTNLGNSLWTYDGTNWWPNAPLLGKLWRMGGAPTSATINQAQQIALNTARVNGGFVADTTTFFDLTLPLDGFYRFLGGLYMTNAATGQVGVWLNRIRATVADVMCSNGGIGYKPSSNIDNFWTWTTPGAPLKAGDRVRMYINNYSNSSLSYFGSGEAQGTWFEAQWIGPLNGAAAI